MRRFAQVDVFGTDGFDGNPVAVVVEADGLDDGTMQAFARWTNLSETTFLLPPTVPGADYRVRIFTTERELPFAGHPTLGTCHAWLATAAGTGAGERIVQECAAGLVPLRRTDAGLAFAAPPLLRSGPVDDALLVRIIAALGLDAEDVVDAEWADNGPGWVALLLRSADAVLAVEPGFIDQDVGLVGATGSGDDAAIEVRALFPQAGAMVEDPVTGSLNAALAGWLLGSGRLSAPYVARQGTRIGRKGRVHVTRDEGGTIWVAGRTVTAVGGTVAL